MAKLALIVEFETTKEYDEAAERYRRLRSKDGTPTPADQLGRQVATVVGGLGYVESHGIDVTVTTVLCGHHTVREEAHAAGGEPDVERKTA